MSQPNQKLQIVYGIFVNRTCCIRQTTFQLPMFLCAVFRFVVCLSLRILFEIPVVYALRPKVSMKKVCPCNHHEDNIGFGLEFDKGIIKDLNRTKSGFFGLYYQLSLE